MAGLLLGAGIASAVWLLSDSGKERDGGDGRVRIEYEPGPREPVKLIQRSGLFEHAADTVNREIAQPRDLVVHVVGDRTAERRQMLGPTYDPDDHAVYFPWSFVQQSHRDLARAGDLPRELRHRDRGVVLANAMAFVLFHEIAHGLFDELDTPIVAGEERSADSLAAVLALRGEADGEALPLSAAVLDVARAERGGAPTLADYADDHGFDRQRAVDARCAVYGAAPEAHQHFLEDGLLEPSRAQICQYEHESHLRAWRRILRGSLTTDGGLLPLDQ